VSSSKLFAYPKFNNLTLAFFSISGGEIFIIILVVFLFFGPDKIPEIARWIGKGLGEVKKATSEIRDEITRETEGIKKEADSLKKSINLNDVTRPGERKSDTNTSSDKTPSTLDRPKEPRL
jgi:sec-independent protein translocase protein TatA